MILYFLIYLWINTFFHHSYSHITSIHNILAPRAKYEIEGPRIPIPPWDSGALTYFQLTIHILLVELLFPPFNKNFQKSLVITSLTLTGPRSID